VKRTVYEIDVDEVGPSLARATAKVTKNPAGGGQRATVGNAQTTRGPTPSPPTASSRAAAGAASSSPPRRAPATPTNPPSRSPT
jgi:single-strand DNA-binding protein